MVSILLCIGWEHDSMTIWRADDQRTIWSVDRVRWLECKSLEWSIYGYTILCIEQIWNLNSIGYNLWLYAVGRICTCVWYSQDYVLQLLRCFSMGWFEVWLVQYKSKPSQTADFAPRGWIGSPKLHGRHQRPEESMFSAENIADSDENWWLLAESWKTLTPQNRSALF